jgi:hypothetical protein
MEEFMIRNVLPDRAVEVSLIIRESKDFFFAANDKQTLRAVLEAGETASFAVRFSPSCPGTDFTKLHSGRKLFG